MQATRQQQVNTWIETVSSNLPHLSKPQATVLALWSFAAVMLRSALLAQAFPFLAGLLGQQSNTLRQRLKEFYKPKHLKKGDQRQELAVETCFAPLAAWIVRLWPAQQLTLALDPTLCRDRFACLSVSLVYDGGSVPLAWKIIVANQKGAWANCWQPLLEQLRQSLPEFMQVIVLADRGLYSKALYQRICALGMHPVMRLEKGGRWRPRGHRGWHRLPEIVPGPGTYYCGEGAMFKTTHLRLRCTLLVLWEAGYKQPWYLITDLTPDACEHTSYYGLRTWIEHGFRCIKSYGMQWEHSRMSDPARMERLWLVYAMSLLWTQAVAGQIEVGAQSLVVVAMSRSDLTGCAGRRISRFRLGAMVLLLALLNGQTLPLPEGLYPEAVPAIAGCKRILLIEEQRE